MWRRALRSGTSGTMLPFEIPPGTTLRTLITDVVPGAHAKLVPQSASGQAFRAVIAIDGAMSFTANVQGAHIDVREGEEKKVDFWMTFDAPVAQRFLDDWMGPQTFTPKFVPPVGPHADLKFPTDPRVLERLAMVSGKVELALTDFPIGDGNTRIAMTLASGAAAKRTIDREDPDVVIEITTDAFLRILAGTLPPEDAIADNQVTLKGKRLVALQFALALSPFFPK